MPSKGATSTRPHRKSCLGAWCSRGAFVNAAIGVLEHTGAFHLLLDPLTSRQTAGPSKFSEDWDRKLLLVPMVSGWSWINGNEARAILSLSLSAAKGGRLGASFDSIRAEQSHTPQLHL